MSTAGFQLRYTTVSALGTSQAASVWLFDRAGVGTALALAFPFVALGVVRQPAGSRTLCCKAEPAIVTAS